MNAATQKIPINEIEVIEASQISKIDFHNLPINLQRLLSLISNLSFVGKIKLPIFKTGGNRYFATYAINQHLYLNQELVKAILGDNTIITDCRNAKPSLNEMILTIELL